MDSNAKDTIFSKNNGTVNDDNIGIVTISDMEFEIDATDPDFMEKLQAVGAAMKNIDGNKADGPDRVRSLVSVLDEHFDMLFGDGSAAKAFPTNSLMKRINAFASIVEVANAQKATLESKMSAFNTKYNVGNRAQRRAEAKKKFNKTKGSS